MGKGSSLQGLSGKEDSYTAKAVSPDSPDYSPVKLRSSYDVFGLSSPYTRVSRFLSSYVERAREATQNLFYRYDLLQRTDDRVYTMWPKTALS